jgi:heat shock protein HtpX
VDLGLFQHVDRNRRRSRVLIGATVLVLGSAGALFGAAWADAPLPGLGAAAALAGVLALGAWHGGSALVLSSAGAREVTKREDPQLVNVVEELAIASGLPPPRIFVVDDAAPNAFATGMRPEEGVVAITTGLRERLTREELQGVMAHEMAHLGNYDTRVMVLLAVTVGTVALLADLFLRGLRGTGGRGGRKGGHPAIALAAVLFAILAPFAARLLSLAVSREREYLADATGAAMTRNPGALADALEKLASSHVRAGFANRGLQHLFIVNPFHPRETHDTVFATHPPIAERIARLRRLAGAAPRA